MKKNCLRCHTIATFLYALLFLSISSFAASSSGDKALELKAPLVVTDDAPSKNLILNGSFESVMDASLPMYFEVNAWQKQRSRIAVDNSVARSGSNSVKIENLEDNDARLIQQVPVEPNSIYHISVWAKAFNVAEKGALGANLSVKDLTVYSRHLQGNTNEWEYIEWIGRTGPNQNSLPLTLGLGGYGAINTGTAWFDDLRVEKLLSPPEGAIVQNLFPPDEAMPNPENASKQQNYFWLLLGLVLCIAFVWRWVSSWKTSLEKETLEKQRDKKRGQKKITPMPTPIQPDEADGQMTKKDWGLALGLSLAYTLFALFNLGSLKAPETFWIPEKNGDTVHIAFAQPQTLSRLNYYFGIGNERDAYGKFRLEYKDPSGNFQYLASFEKPLPEVGNPIFFWQHISLPAVSTSELKIIALNTQVEVRELAFFNDQSTRISDLRILQQPLSKDAMYTASHLFDEPESVAFQADYLNSMYFDEIYHARTAYEYLHGIEPYENTHPPLGKILIALGVKIFGMHPFGWRVIGTLFGGLMILVMYVFAKRIFYSPFLAFCAAFLMMFDFMHFSQTRIATIDSYVTLFIMMMYYFMYVFYIKHTMLKQYAHTLLPFILCGIFFGLGAATKWIALYGSVGIFLLFLIAKLSEYRHLVKSTLSTSIAKFRAFFLLHHGIQLFIFLGFVPLLLYALSYIPYFFIENKDYDFSIVLSNAKDMYNYHSQLKAEHPFQSTWWEWPTIQRPLTFYRADNISPENYSAIATMGNPAIWWVGIFTFFWGLFIAWYQKDRRYLPIVVATLMQYLPWILVPRIAFIYHYFSIVPFMILSIVYCMAYSLKTFKHAKPAIYTYFVIVALLFVFFYPVLSGFEVSKSYVEWLRWGKYWYF